MASWTPLPLTETGREQARAWAERLGVLELRLVLSGEERTSVETARIVASRCRIQHRVMQPLAEVDAGLWEGLTTEELKLRFPKVFKRWCDDPSCVCPPEGEDLEAAQARLRQALDQVMHKYSNRNLAVVLGPLALAVVRCIAESVELERTRSLIADDLLRYEIAEEATALPKGLTALPVAAAPEAENAQPLDEVASQGMNSAG
jgi:probable phosphoglycerate mutase